MSTAKPHFQLTENIKSFVKHFGIEKCGFFTLTFPDDVQCVYEASARFNSLRTGYLSKIMDGYIGVYERHESGRIHFHFVIALTKNILNEYRKGRLIQYDWQAVKKRNYRSVPKSLRDLWAELRETLPKYGFGRHHLEPIQHEKGIAKYLAKYLTKGIAEREHRDKGFRLVRSTSGKAALAWKKVSGAFAWNASGAKEWRASLAWYLNDLKRVWAAIRARSVAKGFVLSELSRKRFHAIAQMDSENYNIVMAEFFGKDWCYSMKDQIWDCYQMYKEDNSFSNATRIENWRESEKFQAFLSKLDSLGIEYKFNYLPE